MDYSPLETLADSTITLGSIMIKDSSSRMDSESLALYIFSPTTMGSQQDMF